MQLHAKQKFQLIDVKQRRIGHVRIERNEDRLIFGKFVPDSAFPEVEKLFRDFETAVNNQALSVLDELDTAIDGLGLQLRSPDGLKCIKVHDVQIWSDGDVTCRLRSERSAAPSGGVGAMAALPMAAVGRDS